jgi:hypothetical protein
MMPFVFVSMFAFLPVIVASLTPDFASAFDRPAGRMFASRSEVIARNGMVCAAQPLIMQQ